jgi:uncharacterized protein (DUF362 family)
MSVYSSSIIIGEWRTTHSPFVLEKEPVMSDRDKTASEAQPVDRRTFLELAAGLGVAVGAGGCMKLPEAPPARTDTAGKSKPLSAGSNTAAAGSTGASAGSTTGATGPVSADEGADPATFVLPGPFPGRVIEVHHPGCLVDGKPSRAAVGAMIASGMTNLTGAPDPTAAWKRFFTAGDVVGIKVNPVGRSTRADRPGVITSAEAILEVIEGLKSAGVKPSDIVVFERYRKQFQECGYDKVAAAAEAYWECAAFEYDETQLDLEGFSRGDRQEKEHGKARQEKDHRISGYDPTVFKSLDFVHPLNDPADPHSRRSHLCNIVSRRCNKIIDLCLLKDHASAGITGALKNMSHGFANNVSRSHGSPGLNQCNTFIPAIVSMPRLRQKVVLHIMEGLRAMHQGGPGVWNAAYGTWEYKSMLFSTDPVAMDRVAWDILDLKRVASGLPPLAKTGLMATGVRGVRNGRDVESETFDYRQPQHVELAGVLGLGVFARTADDWKRWHRDPAKDKLPLIEHKRVAMG